MKVASIMIGLVCTAMFAFGQGQDEKKTKKIKIEITNENGETKVIEEEFSMEEVSAKLEEANLLLEQIGEEELIVMMDDRHRGKRQRHVPHGFLGVHLGKVVDNGTEVKKVIPNSPAEQAGLETGDVIVSVDGREIVKSDGVVEIILEHRPGDEVEIGYERNGEKSAKVAVLKERVPRANYKIEIEEREALSKKAFLGVRPAENVDDVKGVMIKEAVPGSAAQKAGLQTGDVITQVADFDIKSFDDLVEILEQKKPGDEVEVTFLRFGKKQKVTLNLDSMAERAPQKVIIKKRVNDADEVEKIIIKE